MLSTLHISIFKFDLQKGFHFLKQAIISYGFTSLYKVGVSKMLGYSSL